MWRDFESMGRVSPNGQAYSSYHDAFMGLMASYPHLQYSMKAVRKAGRELAGNLPFDGNASYVHALANSWRDSHFFPMRSTLYSVRHKLRTGNIKGNIVARPKRMASIRRKLRESSTKLDQMNDIAGCRAILDDITGVRELTDRIREKFPHELRQEWELIEDPKKDGYRSHHMVFKFRSQHRDQEHFEGRRIGLQI